LNLEQNQTSRAIEMTIHYSTEYSTVKYCTTARLMG
jgi:hypothetical protein